MRKVIGIGETILDIIFKDNQPHKAVPGGSVFNGFVSLARLGVPLAFISELGNDKVGDIIRAFMDENGISTEYVDRFPDGKSPVSLAFLKEQNQAEYVFYKDYPNQRLEVPFPRIEADDILIFGSYYSLNPALRQRTLELLEYAHDRKAIIYYDPNFRKAHAHEAIRLLPTVFENLEFADIVRGSDEDLYNLFGKEDIKQVYEEHIRFYCNTCITTHGKDGVDLFVGKEYEHFTTPSISPLSTIGAGDSLNAGIIYALLKYDIRRDDLPQLTKEVWAKIIRCGIDLATEVCMNYDNYISATFADTYRQGMLK
ncbi:fructokinase [Parabacteroides sp. PF5-5]|uniref:carbohydrate kinase family protein n=1 Tax=unclassified Parabacteroides TaxID=2649774 RepID=UPI0024738F83|nr:MULTISPECIES: carbohydrate kinase [unclassified Parabacteroides]MDH6303484.1 fructokinase [Parabacteroides sp. PH5-39]MDH6314806.1 fructokinase [Parabacteroides sp. PF5-13]MDH6318143.1 fructokinase [Parabacteroides sp. PH5-13]MDH6321925.1 fructokinase [Parabacteroides sp. PH5-8]MDH6326049.1 fructokinase [Parabacteroides sp. PH5-41]